MNNKNKKVKLICCVSVSMFLIVIFALLCTLAYKLNWKLNAFWWPWLISLIIIDVVTSWIIFHDNNKSSELKTFWMFNILAIPYFGFIGYLFFGTVNDTNNGSNPNRALILENIFSAKESITVCATTFFTSYDIFDALKFAGNTCKKVTIIINKQKSKYLQEIFHIRLEKLLSNKCKVYFYEYKIKESFMIFDEKKVILANENFNFKNIFNDNKLSLTDDKNDYKNLAKMYLAKATFDECKQPKRSLLKKLWYSFANIFYIFL